MAGGFKRSSRFGIIGVFVVAALCAAIGLTMGSGEANPKLALSLIFAVIAVYCVILFALQRTDLNRVSGSEARDSSRAAAEGGRERPKVDIETRDGRVRPKDGAPENIIAALKQTPNSTRWKQVAVEGGPEGIVVTRKGGGQADWLCDLWLAERLAEC